MSARDGADMVVRRGAGVNTLTFQGNTYDLNALDTQGRKIALHAFHNQVRRMLPNGSTPPKRKRRHKARR